ncbi:hypothetical protein BGZ83_000174 [Gryganskiella cystojenkinii]|nr:hypothetical protein BGZ83_000174 [Gryganskiella cystojenkinii]
MGFYGFNRKWGSNNKWTRTSRTRSRSQTSTPQLVGYHHLLPNFDYNYLFDILLRNRDSSRQVLVGSHPLFQDLDEALDHCYHTIILRRVRKFYPGDLGVLPVPIRTSRLASLSDSEMGSCEPGHNPLLSTSGEQAVDEMLQLKMLETLIDAKQPAIMVLASGDGAESEFGGQGFYDVIRRALDRGWIVEIVSWEDQLSGAYIDLAREYGYGPDDEKDRDDGQQKGHLRVLLLDWFAGNVMDYHCRSTSV